MDLLDGILGDMKKYETQKEKVGVKKLVQEEQAKRAKIQQHQDKANAVRDGHLKRTIAEMEAMIKHSTKTQMVVPVSICVDESLRTLIHAAAEEKGLVSHSFGEVGSKYMVIWKSHVAPPAEVLIECEKEEDIPLMMERYHAMRAAGPTVEPVQAAVKRRPVKNTYAETAPKRSENDIIALPSVKKERWSVAETLAERGRAKRNRDEADHDDVLEHS
eukprot:TRINITY_DN13650_c0_g1_i1.p1 TRINITY_DN13650_c0_g1~~TRINITY_DN13650_c0_g1_i1.p1  ORF type:complete len:226 (+),score=43.73 TRINITY_DN13650_c0_g1_i1:28-678(+)